MQIWKMLHERFHEGNCRPICRTASGRPPGRGHDAPFSRPRQLSNLVLQVSIVAIVAIGSTMVILAGGIDFRQVRPSR